ncbi:CPBP family intramembrane metalloprotease [Arthrobacter sp. zg-Y1171]|uniref:CPBP family intramembrane metalloprotease n=1 Tax=Arthrobacter sp. zg-Y1171 TaxID=2964610 RepID=UPI002104D5BC|nr:CPBP family intramembrane metalloprotease [Arthrobacter sp. zg-Y1171]MCQ1995795.1 CPBP family intramembrane metalloprotease [Arthrobacter sp. zg-Y1171]UWX83124.1 CPBP family intramembrane metalloprotease [Arthrobacter sp. zg-Y1171]
MPARTPTAVTSHLPDQTRQPIPRWRALQAAVLGWAFLGIGLGTAIGIAEALGQAFGWGRLPEVLLQAVLMSAVVVPGIVLLRRRLDHRDLEGLGLSRSAARPLALGMAVGALTGLLVWLPAGLAGWIRVEQLDLAAFLGFLLLNGVVLALYEALPEELALRGYVWTNLRDGWGLAVATLVTTALFPFVGVVVGPVRWAITTVLGGDGGGIEVFPAGNDPIVYIVQLVLFGLALVAARRIPVPGALLVAVAFHWTQLTVTRTILGGTGWLDSGWTIVWVEPDAIAMVLVHIILAGVAFIAVRRRLQRRAGRAGAAA